MTPYPPVTFRPLIKEEIPSEPALLAQRIYANEVDRLRYRRDFYAVTPNDEIDDSLARIASAEPELGAERTESVMRLVERTALGWDWPELPEIPESDEDEPLLFEVQQPTEMP